MFSGFSSDFLLQMLYQGIMPNVVGLLLVAYAAKNIGSAATAAFLAGVPPLSTIIAFIFLHETLGLLGWVSIVLIAPGIVLVAINKKTV
jgi:drug/metabolite transporter (DMT)-like permease